MRSRSTCFILFAIAIVLMPGISSAQSYQQLKNDSTFALVKKYFNARNPDSIYAMAGERFRVAYSADAFRDVAERQLFPLGKITESSLISFVNNKVSTYKLTFDSSPPLQFLLSLDMDNKLEMFLFQPYKKDPGTKPDPVGTSNLMRTVTDKKVDTAARLYIQKANTVGLSIGILKNGIIHTYNYGETAIGNAKLPNANNLFEIGSITKTFTATLLAYYVNEGKIKLTDPITKFLPDSVAANKELQAVTLLTLSNHTSGLPRLPDNFEYHSSDPLNPYKDYTKEYLFSYLKTCKLNSKPGEVYAYSNLAVGLLGTILEKVSGKSFEQMVQEIICEPLGMKATAIYLTPGLRQRFVTVYNEDSKATSAWDFGVLAPCGALRSTVNDLLIYAKGNMIKSDTKLSRAFELTHQVTFNKDAKLGLNWHIIKVDGVEYIFHNGGTYGCSSFLAFNTEKNIAIVVLSNAGVSTDELGTNILKKIQ